MPAHVRTRELHDLRAGHEPVQDRFSDHRVVQRLVPVLGIELARYCGRALTLARGKNVEQLGRGLARDRCREEIIKHEQVTRVESFKEPQPCRVCMLEHCELVREVIEPVVLCAVIATAGRVHECLREVRFPHA